MYIYIGNIIILLAGTNTYVLRFNPDLLRKMQLQLKNVQHGYGLLLTGMNNVVLARIKKVVLASMNRRLCWPA